MYAVGASTFRLRSTHGSRQVRHVGRWLAVSAVILATSIALARVAAGGTEPVGTVVVKPGDTLWAIERLNGLDSPLIVAGETLQLPPP